ncbi:hypothetical protein [Haloferula sp.]|uniref:hypothetical protein n=1 Tax=Haloferula sp. TaxID=2497595 RepID=UPI00329A89A1
MDAPQPSPPETLPESRIPRRELWKCLLMPTILTVGANLITAAGGTSVYMYSLWYLPLIVGPIAGFICTPWFVKILKISYRGRGMVLMSIGYALGQLILTPAIGLGGCLLTAETFGA